MNTGGTDRDRVVRQRALYTVAVLAVSDPADEHGVDLEPETEREHDAKVAPPLGPNRTTPACYSAGEEGDAEAAGASR